LALVFTDGNVIRSGIFPFPSPSQAYSALRHPGEIDLEGGVGRKTGKGACHCLIKHIGHENERNGHQISNVSMLENIFPTENIRNV